MSARFVKFLILGAAVAALSGCSSTDDEKNCPLATSLVDTSSLTVFHRGAPQDPKNALYTVQITKVDSDCSRHKYEHTFSASTDIDFTATRAAAGAEGNYSVPYFLAVTEGGNVISKRRFVAHIHFDSGEQTVTFSNSIDSDDVKLAKTKKAYDYSILVGFQLTPDQLEYNRTVGRYAK